MKRHVALAVAAASAWSLATARPSAAADPAAAACLEASDASLRASHEHRLRAERAALMACAAPECPAVIRKECLGRVDEVTSQIPTVVFEVKDGAGRDLADVVVTMDGEVVAQHLDGTAVMLDPGPHTFRFEGPGGPAATLDVILREGDKGRRLPVVVGATEPLRAEPPRAPPASGDGRAQRVAGIAVGAAGLGGLGVGVVLGGLALASWTTAKDACPARTACSSSAVSKSGDAVTLGTGSTAAFVVGAALVAGGVTLYFTAPRRREAVTARLGPGSLSVAGSF